MVPGVCDEEEEVGVVRWEGVCDWGSGSDQSLVTLFLFLVGRSNLDIRMTPACLLILSVC